VCSWVHVAVGWLGELLVSQHLVLETNKAGFHAHVGSPVSKNVEAGLDVAVALVYRWDVDLRGELDDGWSDGVILAAFESQEVDTVVVVGAWGTNDRAIPVSE